MSLWIKCCCPPLVNSMSWHFSSDSSGCMDLVYQKVFIYYLNVFFLSFMLVNMEKVHFRIVYVLLAEKKTIDQILQITLPLFLFFKNKKIKNYPSFLPNSLCENQVILLSIYVFLYKILNPTVFSF